MAAHVISEVSDAIISCCASVVLVEPGEHVTRKVDVGGLHFEVSAKRLSEDDVRYTLQQRYLVMVRLDAVDATRRGRTAEEVDRFLFAQCEAIDEVFRPGSVFGSLGFSMELERDLITIKSRWRCCLMAAVIPFHSLFPCRTSA